MKKIIFPTDFSKTSLNAFEYALNLASKIDAEIITLHVYDKENPGTYLDMHDFLAEVYDIHEWDQFENYRNTVSKLNAIAEKANLSHIPINHVLQRGAVTYNILALATKEKADFIVMGSKGATGLKKIFLGSIAEAVMVRSKIPVLAVPDQSSFKPIKKVLFPTTFKRRNISTLKKIVELAGLFDASVEVLQVKGDHDEDEKTTLLKWKEKFKGSDVNFTIYALDDVEETILTFVETHQIDIIAMPVHRRRFLEKLFTFSLTRDLVFHSTVPVLGIYERAE